MMNSKISVIIVTYNSQKHIEDCLKSIFANSQKEIEVIVIDNNSQDQTVKLVQQFKQVKLISSPENLGFAKGNNQAAKQAQGEYLFFLNPDTKVHPGAILRLLEFYKNTPDAGIVAPKLVVPDGSIQDSVSKTPSVWGAAKQFIFGKKQAFTQYHPKGEAAVPVEVVYGAALFINKDLFDQLNGFDKRYFLYYEDIDLCNRVRESGKKVYYVPDAEILHQVGGSETKLDRYKLNTDSAKIYYGTFGWFILQLIFLLPRLQRKLHLS